MDYFAIVDAFTRYGADVALLSAVTAVLTQALKLTALKKLAKRYLAFLPFIIGVLLYAVYTAAVNLSVSALADVANVLTRGISVGSGATFLYVMYEQFVRGKGSSGTESVVAAMIEGYVPSDKLDEAAKALVFAISEESAAERAEEVLAAYSDGDIPRAQLTVLARLLVRTIALLGE